MTKRKYQKTREDKPWRGDPTEVAKRTGAFPDWGLDYLEESGTLREAIEETVAGHTAEIEAGKVTVPEITQLAMDAIKNRYIEPEEVQLAEVEGILSEVDQWLDTLSYEFKNTYSAAGRAEIMGEKRQLLTYRDQFTRPLAQAGLLDPIVESTTVHVEINEDQAEGYLNPEPETKDYQSNLPASSPERPAPPTPLPPRMHPKSED